ncbi:MAG: CPBP family intramembrane metalloprotease [Rikenellaceae bacterium]|nr:CPBP family intramembrane metalloprotease [Rikenellaceae bacterium]
MGEDKDRNGQTGTAPGGWDVSISSSVGEGTGSGAAASDSTPAAAEEPAVASAPEKVRYPQWLILLAIVGVCIISDVVSSILFLKIHPDTGFADGFSLFLYYTVKLTVSIAFAWWICRRHGNLPAKPLSFSLRKTNPTLILWGLVLVIITSMVIEPLLEIFPNEYLEKMYSSVGRGGWAMLTTIVMAPLLEEILFRGILQQNLTGGFGKLKGILMASAVFGLIHMIPQQAINAFFIGIILGYLYVRSGSLVTPIIIHALNNAIAFLVLILSRGDVKFTREMFTNETFYWIIYGVCCMVFILAGWNLLRELKKLDRAGTDELPVGTAEPL